jgi:hypothetical protein
MKRSVDRTKKSNRKCEHCKFFEVHRTNIDKYGHDTIATDKCLHPESTRPIVHYWNCCKNFEWAEEK